MKNEKFKKWVVENIKKGYSKEDIKNFLKNFNYPLEYFNYIDKIYEEIEKKRKQIKEYEKLGFILIFLVIILFLILWAFSFSNVIDRKIPNMNIEECIKRYTEPNDTIVAWWDWGNLIEENGRRAVIKTPSPNYLKYTVNPKFKENELANEETTREIAYLLTTNNTTAIKNIMNKFNSKFILIALLYNKKLLPILMENTKAECDTIECTFSYQILHQNKRYKCFPIVCRQNMTYALIKNVC